jgi:hypothetical protein
MQDGGVMLSAELFSDFRERGGGELTSPGTWRPALERRSLSSCCGFSGGNTESSFFNDNVETGSAEMTPAADALFAVSFRSAR